MTGGFNVEPEQLAAHAQSVDQVAQQVEQARAASATQNFGGLVYGIFFDPIAVTALSTWADHITGLIADDAAAGRAIATGLRNNAETYAGVEHATHRTVGASGGGGF